MYAFQNSVDCKLPEFRQSQSQDAAHSSGQRTAAPAAAREAANESGAASGELTQSSVCHEFEEFEPSAYPTAVYRLHTGDRLYVSRQPFPAVCRVHASITLRRC